MSSIDELLADPRTKGLVQQYLGADAFASPGVALEDTATPEAFSGADAHEDAPGTHASPAPSMADRARSFISGVKSIPEATLNRYAQATDANTRQILEAASVPTVKRSEQSAADARKVKPPATVKPSKSRDPKSPESLMAQNQLSTLLPNRWTPEELSQFSEAAIAEMKVPELGTRLESIEAGREKEVGTQKRFNAQENRLRDALAQRLGFDREKLDRMLEMEGLKLTDAKEAREETKLEKEVLEISKRLENLPGMKNDLTTLKLFAEESDVPGTGATGSVPAKLLTDEGLRVRQAARGVVGMLIKEQSGTAVSEPELDRKLEELGMGPTSSDREFRAGLKRLLTNTDAVMKTREAGVSPAAVKRFKERGGTTSADLPRVTPQQAFTKDAGGQPTLAPEASPKVRVRRKTDDVIREVSPEDAARLLTKPEKYEKG